MTDETTQEEPKKRDEAEGSEVVRVPEVEKSPEVPASHVRQDDSSEKLDTAFERLEQRKDEEAVAAAKPASSVPGILALLLSLVAIGIGSFALYTLYKPQDTSPLDTLSRQVSSDLTNMQKNLQNATTELAQVTTRLGDMEGRQSESLASLKQSLESRITDLQATTGTRSQDWILAEVEYLLRMGNQRVLMERDPKGALALFEAADRIIADAQGMTAFSLRSAMAIDIASLAAVKTLDREGIYLRLSAFAGQVSELKQIELNYTPPEISVGTVTTTETTILNRLWNFVRKAGSRIVSLIDFRRDQVRVTPILPPSEEYFLQQNLILKLQVAQIALLESNQEIYSTSISESVAWVEKYYDPEDAATMSMNSGLEALLAINIQTEMPDVTASLRAVRELLSGFHQSEDKP